MPRKIHDYGRILVALLGPAFLGPLGATVAVAAPTTYLHATDATCQGNSPCYDAITDALQNVDNGGTVVVLSDISGSIFSTEGRQDITLMGIDNTIEVASQIVLEETVTGWTLKNLDITNGCIIRDVAGSITIDNVRANIIKVGDLTHDTTANIIIRNSTARAAGNITIRGEPGSSLGGSILVEDSVAFTVQIQLQVDAGPVTALSSDITIVNNQLALAGAVSIVGNGTSGVGALTGPIEYSNNSSSIPEAKFGILTFGDMTGNISSPITFDNNQLAWIAVLTFGSNSGGITGPSTVTNNTVKALEWVTTGGPISGTMVFRDNQVLELGDVTPGVDNPLLLIDGVGLGNVTLENNFAPDGDVVARASSTGSINGTVRALGNTAGLLTIDSRGGDFLQPIDVIGNTLPSSTDPALSRLTLRSTSNGDLPGGVIRGNTMDELTVNLAGFLTGDLDTTGNVVRQLTTLNANGTLGATHTVSGNDLRGSVSLNGLHSTVQFNRIGEGIAVIPGTTVDATLNWWKCDEGPGQPGCSEMQTAGFPVSPWLTFSGEAECDGTNAVATFDLLRASNGSTPPGNISPGSVTISTPNGTVVRSPVELSEGAGCTLISVQPGTNNPSITMQLDSESIISVPNCSAGLPLPPCALFADGFESGDTSAWSSTVPQWRERPASPGTGAVVDEGPRTDRRTTGPTPPPPAS